MRGQKNLCQRAWKKTRTLQRDWGWMGGKFIAPFSFQGGCNAGVFNHWLETLLLPQLPKGTTLIMDNAAFHKTPKTLELIQQFGCHLLFLPTYSLDLNPIEHCWNTLKSRLRPLVQKSHGCFHDLLDVYLLTI